ncbi:MAG TPA: LTA synthase family protein [Vulgatibacter sp.]|nr:LTA synthase family protein [Vulgatibacter sp.]
MGGKLDVEGGRLRVALWLGLALVALAIAFRVFEFGVTSGEVEIGRAAFASLPVIGLILVGECSLLLLGRVASLQRHWRLGAELLHLAGALAIAAESRYFQVTGTRMDLELLAYSVRNASTLGGVAGVGADPAMLASAVFASLILALAIRLERRSKGRSRFTGAALELSLATLGLVLFVGAVPSGKGMNAATIGAMLGDEWANLRIRLQTDYVQPTVRSLPEEKVPNFLIVILESTRADALGAYRNPGGASDTPFLDRLASGGVVVDKAYAAVTHTSKALVGILCGAFPRLQTEIGEAEERGIPMACLPNVLRDAGYRSRFMQSATGEFEHRTSLLRNMGFDGWATKEDLDLARFEEVGYFGMDERALVEPALDWLSESEEPFLLTILTSVTHHPYHVPGELPPETLEEQWAHYLRTIAHTDEALEQLIPEVQRRWPDTVVIVIGDHGEGFDEHVARGHNLVPYEEGVRVPLILAGPEARLGEPHRIEGLRHQIDLLPTVLNLTGIEWDGALQGEDLLSSDGHEYVMSSCWQSRRCLAMRVGDMKFIYRYGRGEMEVYDLVADPREQTNVAGTYPSSLLKGVESMILEARGGVDQYYFFADRRRSR